MYTIGQASVRSGVSIPLLRAWQRRYGVVQPERTAAGYRLYSEADIARLVAMRQLLERGWSAREAAAAVINRGAPAQAERRGPATTGDPSSLIQRFVASASAMDGAGLERLLDEMLSLGSFETTAQSYVMPALVAIGAAWQAGELDVAAEHAAAHAVLRRLAAAFQAAAQPSATERPVLVGLPPGSHHELGALAFAVAARRAGLPVTFLGADLPVADWVNAARGTTAAAAVVAIPTDADRDAAVGVLRALRSADPSLLLAAGGSGAAESLSRDGALILPTRLDEAAAALAREISRAG